MSSPLEHERGLAPSTVKKHLEHVYAKLGVGRRAAVAAARYAARG